MPEKRDPVDLEPFFAAEREEGTAPPDRLMEAVLRDAHAQQPAPVPLAPGAPRSARGSERGSWLARRFGGLWGDLGGGLAAGLLSACLLLGLGIGMSTPDLAEQVLSGVGLTAAGGGDNLLDDLMAEG